MRIKYLFTFLLVALSIDYANAQDDLLSQLDTIKSKKKEIEIAAFKGLQICNMQSTKLSAKNEWYFLVSHRFGDLTEGFDNFFGLDNANTKIGGLYGVTNWLTLGVSRHTYNKIYELTAKYKLANQEVDGFPVTIVGYNTMDINSALSTSLYPNLESTDRCAYSTQLLVSRKFNEKLSFELTPIFIHKNLYDDTAEQNNLFVISAGGRYKISRRMSINLEYAARILTENGMSSTYNNPLTLGLDIETGGHVFQLVVSNSQQMNDVSVFTNTTGQWFDVGSIYFGFNMYRSF